MYRISEHDGSFEEGKKKAGAGMRWEKIMLTVGKRQRIILTKRREKSEAEGL